MTDNEDIFDANPESPDFSGTNSSYTSPRYDTGSESSTEDIEILDQNIVADEVTQSCDESIIQESSASMARTPLSENLIEEYPHVKDVSLISNSPCRVIVIERKFSKPASSSVDTVNNEHCEAVDDSYKFQIEENSNDCIRPIPMNQTKSANEVRGKDFCFYCKAFVLNFARHLLRHHINETDVQKIVSKPKKSLERKSLIMAIRKKGNFIQNSAQITKPMRKQQFAEYLPCTNCLGFYSKKLLWKHKKKCTGSTARCNVQSEAQNLLLEHLKIDEKLKEIVFPHMRADKISLTAKSDVLICAFGSQFLKTHRDKHFVHVVSRKMRELAKLLIEIKKINASVKDLFDALKPVNYDVIIAATKILGKYDAENDRYESPTFPMNICTSIKQCCNIAIMFALKKQRPYAEVDTGVIESDLKTLMQIIDATWKYDVSSQAASDLNKNKWNKVTIVPLAQDLTILEEYLNEKSKEAANIIKEGSFTIGTYIQLLETVYCKTLLLNRCRPGELQRIKVHEYLEIEGHATDKYEEYGRALSVSERVLVKKFKRVVIRGKRGCGVPVLFPLEVQEHIELLLSIRDRFLSTSNHFLFGNPGVENTIYGYKVLERHARLSGVKNPKSITSTRLRKHLATLSQIFCMSENDKEQLVTFMGHINEVHKRSYRLPDDVYQTAKISKLLILMENGKADAFKGKSLDEIELDLNEELDEGEIENNQILEYDIEPTEDSFDGVHQTHRDNESPRPGPSGLQNKPSQLDHQTPASSITANNAKGKKKRILIRWTAEQKKVVTKFFKLHLKNHQPPKRHECEKLKDTYPELLSNKDWLKIKVFIQNTYTNSLK